MPSKTKKGKKVLNLKNVQLASIEAITWIRKSHTTAAQKAALILVEVSQEEIEKSEQVRKAYRKKVFWHAYRWALIATRAAALIISFEGGDSLGESVIFAILCAFYFYREKGDEERINLTTKDAASTIMLKTKNSELASAIEIVVRESCVSYFKEVKSQNKTAIPKENSNVLKNQQIKEQINEKINRKKLLSDNLASGRERNSSTKEHENINLKLGDNEDLALLDRTNKHENLKVHKLINTIKSEIGTKEKKSEQITTNDNNLPFISSETQTSSAEFKTKSDQASNSQNGGNNGGLTSNSTPSERKEYLDPLELEVLEEKLKLLNGIQDAEEAKHKMEQKMLIIKNKMRRKQELRAKRKQLSREESINNFNKIYQPDEQTKNFSNTLPQKMPNMSSIEQHSENAQIDESDIPNDWTRSSSFTIDKIPQSSVDNRVSYPHDDSGTFTTSSETFRRKPGRQMFPNLESRDGIVKDVDNLSLGTLTAHHSLSQTQATTASSVSFVNYGNSYHRVNRINEDVTFVLCDEEEFEVVHLNLDTKDENKKETDGDSSKNIIYATEARNSFEFLEDEGSLSIVKDPSWSKKDAVDNEVTIPEILPQLHQIANNIPEISRKSYAEYRASTDYYDKLLQDYKNRCIKNNPFLVKPPRIEAKVKESGEEDSAQFILEENIHQMKLPSNTLEVLPSNTSEFSSVKRSHTSLSVVEPKLYIDVSESHETDTSYIAEKIINRNTDDDEEDIVLNNLLDEISRAQYDDNTVEDMMTSLSPMTMSTFQDFAQFWPVVRFFDPSTVAQNGSYLTNSELQDLKSKRMQQKNTIKKFLTKIRRRTRTVDI